MIRLTATSCAFETIQRSNRFRLGREIVEELRNEGHVEEELRGTIRLIPRGYRVFQNNPPP
jgi:hypothetical protein